MGNAAGRGNFKGGMGIKGFKTATALSVGCIRKEKEKKISLGW